MLNCVLDMVDKTKKGINVLQVKTLQFQKQIENYEYEVKQKNNELISNALRQTEEKIAEIQKRAGKNIFSKKVYILKLKNFKYFFL